LLIAICVLTGNPFHKTHWPKPANVKGISLKRIVMIALEPLRAPQAIHAACVSLPITYDVKQPGRSPSNTLDRTLCPASEVAAYIGRRFPSQHPFFALSAELRSDPRNLQFSAQNPAFEMCLAAPLNQLSVSGEGGV